MHKIALTINEVCYGLGIGRTKAYELINDGELESFKVGRRTLVTACSIEDFVGRALTSSYPEQATIPPPPPFRLRLVPTEGSDEK